MYTFAFDRRQTCFCVLYRLFSRIIVSIIKGERNKARSRIRKNAFDYLPLHDLYNPAKRCTPRTLALASLLRASVMNPPILLLNASFEHLKGKDAELVWQEVKTILTENLAFLYLGSAPAPAYIEWTAQISGR